MDNNDITQHRGESSPFDAIRRTRPDGSDYWSARDLMPVMGYSKWDHFETPLHRAMQSAGNQSMNLEAHFPQSRKVSGARGPAQKDYELTRFAAYLVAMNGDPNKNEVAAAQAYFAIRTREAETAPQIDMSDPLAVIAAESARVAKAVEIAKSERAGREKAELKLAVERKHRAAIEGGDGIHLSDFGKKYFSEVPARKFDEHLYAKGWLINQRNTRIRPDGSVRDGYDHRKPTAKGRPFIYDHDQGNYGGKRRFQPRVRPQKEIELRDALAAEGLPVNTHSTGLVLVTNDEMKELGA
ncbi:BRO family protein [Gordonia sp. DT219]|uniref:BRO family protein n=1 Tax=Gordonia sp. DT219 TaxID=3416658 RepID=UPI003CE7681F